MMRLLAPAAAIGLSLLLSACGPAGGSSAPTPTPAHLIAVLQTKPPGAEGGGYQPARVALVDWNGSVKASADFEARLRPYIGNAAVPLQTPAQVAGDTVYYIDGFGTVRALRVGAQPRVVASFGTQPAQYETWFAVSPDGSSVLAGILQFPAIGTAPANCTGLECMPPLVGPWSFTLARSDAGKTPVVLQRHDYPVHPDTPVGAWHPEFPVAWTSEGPIVMVPVSVGTQNAWWGGPLYVMGASGNRQVGGSDCSAASVIGSRFIPCTSGRYVVSVRDLSGKVLWTPHIDGFDALMLGVSPDGTGVINDHQVETRALGMVTIPTTFYVEGWLDSETIVGRPVTPYGGANRGDLSWISLRDPFTIHDMGILGDFAGTVG